MKRIHSGVVLAGVAVGLAARILTALGNPANMGFCIACFERDIAGAVGLHSAAKVQYVRPEIIGLVLGSVPHERGRARSSRPRAGSSPALRFVTRRVRHDRRARLPRLPAAYGAPSRRRRPERARRSHRLLSSASSSASPASSSGFTLKRSYEVKRLRGQRAADRDGGAFDPRADRTRAVQGRPRRAPAPSTRRSWIALIVALVVGALAQKSPPLHGRRSARRRDAGGLPPALRLRGDFCRHARRQSCHQEVQPWLRASAHRPQRPRLEPAGHGARRLGQRAARAAARCVSSSWRRRATATAP